MRILKSLAASALMLSALSLSAQESRTQPELRLVSPEQVVFNPHWFMQLQGGAGMTVGENEFKKLLSPAAAVNLGYRFSPAFSLRAGASGWMAKGSWVNPRNNYKYKYLQGNVDAMLSLTNLFCGFNPKRTLDFYGFLGVGLNGAFHNNEANDIQNSGNAKFEYLWSGHKIGVAGRGGLGVDIRLCDAVALNLEANANGLSDHWNSKRGGNLDWQFNLLAGVTIRFGNNTKVIPAVYEEIPATAPAPAPAPAPEPAPAPAPAPVKKAAPMTQDIFFHINSARIRPEEMPKIDALIDYLKTNTAATVTVTGYADKGTGSASYNMAISQRRADTVRAALMAGGVSADRINEDAKGDTVQPFSVNNKNRVVIAVAEE